MELNNKFRYVLTFNQLAMDEYYKTKKLTPEKELEIKKKMNSDHYLLLDFIIYCCTNDKLKKTEIDNVVYTNIDNRFILQNLPIITHFGVDEKSRISRLRKWIGRLNKFGFIQIKIINKNNIRHRYVIVNQLLLDKHNKQLSPLELILKYRNKELKEIELEYKDKLPYKRYDQLKVTFFDTERTKQLRIKIENKNNYIFDAEDLLSRFSLYLDECINDPYFERHRTDLQNGNIHVTKW